MIILATLALLAIAYAVACVAYVVFLCLTIRDQADPYD